MWPSEHWCGAWHKKKRACSVNIRDQPENAIEKEAAISLSEAAIDAEWKRIQKKTFTRWCNEHLKKHDSGHSISEIGDDFSDGLCLIILLEVLSQKRVGRYNKKPKVHAQKMENLQLALDFITKKEGIYLVNIGSGDIISGNLKLILGLIWTLILHYQISIGFGLKDDSDPLGRQGKTGKQALLEWLQKQLPDKKITNFTSDWSDGVNVAALVDAVAPGLCPENEAMDPVNALHNASHAMKLAEDWLDVPMLLGPEDMVNPHVDELSMMTYLSQFPDAHLKEGAPIKAKADLSKIKIYGPGVEREGIDTDMPSADFTVDTKEAGAFGRLAIDCDGPNGPVPVDIKDNDDGTFSCSYDPKDVGEHQVKVAFNNKPAGESPYRVNVTPGASMPKPSNVKAYGPGLEKAMVQEPAEFVVDVAGAGDGDVGISISGPEECQVTVDDKGDGKYHCSYIAPRPGVYNIDVKFADQEVPGSPFEAICSRPPPDASKCVISGLENPNHFKVDCINAGGTGLLEVGVSGAYIPCEYVSVKHNGDYTFDVSYDIREPGETTISVAWHGQHLKGSPFTVVIGASEV